jgi:hypothetical protein
MNRPASKKWRAAGLKALETKRRNERLGRVVRRDTHMPAAGAEHYVVAQLMFRNIDAFKCERGRAGIDIVAADTRRQTSISIQVKSRHSHTATGFLIKEPKAPFIVFAKLNLTKIGERLPICYVFPARVVRAALKKGARSNWTKCVLTHIRNHEQYREAWGLIEKALRRKA